MKYKFYPDEVADVITHLAYGCINEESEMYSDIQECITWLWAAAENPYNAKYFRAFYEALQQLTDEQKRN